MTRRRGFKVRNARCCSVRGRGDLALRQTAVGAGSPRPPTPQYRASIASAVAVVSASSLSSSAASSCLTRRFDSTQKIAARRRVARRLLRVAVADRQQCSSRASVQLDAYSSQAASASRSCTYWRNRIASRCFISIGRPRR